MGGECPKIFRSLYKSAIDLKIQPNIIVEFARLYGFQVDFQRDIWKNDSFQIIYEEFKYDLLIYMAESFIIIIFFK